MKSPDTELTGLLACHHVNTLGRINEALPGFIRNKMEPGERPSSIFENSKGQKKKVRALV